VLDDLPIWREYAAPIRFTDPDGMAPNPGDAFKSADDAAHDFAKLYNPNAVKDNKEFATTIYKVGEGKDAYYTYTPPVEGETATADPRKAGSGLSYTDVASAHLHGAYSGNNPDLNQRYKDNEFSGEDVDYAKGTNMPLYVGTPNGSLQKVDTKGNINIVPNANDIPSDQKDPTHKNNIDATKKPSATETYSVGDWLKFKILLPIGEGLKSIKN